MFSHECSQGRAAWQERERGRRGSLSDEARQHRLKQSDAHHRWMKRNRIHDTTYGGSTDDEEMFNVYHQSAAANALLYVGLGTIAIGSVIFFVGTGEKGFKTLELRLIGPTLIACGLLCCLIRVLLCACPSKCVRGRKKTRLKNSCPHNNSRYPLSRKRDRRKDFVPVEKASLMHHNNHKKVSIATANNNNAIPSTSTMNFQEPAIYVEEETQQQHHHQHQGSPLKPPIPLISVPDFVDFNSDAAKRISRENSIIELQNLEIAYDLQSISSCDSDTVIEVETAKVTPQTRIVKSRESRGVGIGRTTSSSEYVETCLSVVIEKRDLDDDISVASDMERVTKNNRNNGDGDVVIKVNEISDYMTIKTSKDNGGNDSEKQRNNSEIVLSPLQLGQ
ncbi:hypothetical protein QE152_g9860 [Popillia japonica]|uniref:Uncharacterized protein n=1 Tax=Popillia japonica TaxID=7064 RepID=A0AAW1LYX0_POPJA